MKTLFLIGSCLYSLAAFAGPEAKSGNMHPPPYKGSAALEMMKSLAGTWKGKMPMGKDKKMQDVTIHYKVAGNGSTVVETTFPNTPQEMVTIYFDDRKKLSMTHYCSMGNQPKMKAAATGKNSIQFKFAGGTNLNPKKDMHMHNMTLKMENKNKITQQWTMYNKGKKTMVSTMSLTRSQ